MEEITARLDLEDRANTLTRAEFCALLLEAIRDIKGVHAADLIEGDADTIGVDFDGPLFFVTVENG